jgi:hypothetical protein
MLLKIRVGKGTARCNSMIMYRCASLKSGLHWNTKNVNLVGSQPTFVHARIAIYLLNSVIPSFLSILGRLPRFLSFNEMS